MLLCRASSIENFSEYIALTALAMSSLNRRIRALDHCSRLAASRISRSSSASSVVCQVIAVPLRQLTITAKTCCSECRRFISFKRSTNAKTSRKVTCFSPTTGPSPSALGLKNPISSARRE